MIRSMNLIMTNACNLRCSFCLNASGKAFKNELSVEEWKRVIDLFEDLSYVKMTGGGEPLNRACYPKTYEVAKYLTDVKKSIVQINTNGTNPFPYNDLDKELLRFQVSIDGSREGHDALRGKGVYDKAINFIKEQKAKGYEVRIFKVITERNWKEINAVIDLSKELDVPLSFRMMHQVGRGANLDLAKDIYKIVDELSLMGYQCKDEVKRCQRSLGGGAPSITIDSEGYYIPCPMFPELRGGKVLDPAFNEDDARENIRRLQGNKTCTYPQGYNIEY